MFQEVYDWAGAMSAMPLHFTFQRRSEVVLHNQPNERHEVLDIYDRVSFKGNQPTDVQSELETTSTDVQSELETTFNAKFNESGRDLKTTGSKRKLEQQVYQKEKDNENKEEERGEKSKNMISSKEQETRVDSKKRRKKEKRSGSRRKKVKETLK
ncbi:DEAD-box ATP-dependent RNA helicase 42-like isoform X3 [Acropora millepora]|uniref:DEAD-box ATP-dependent RNA helicase 42-like isoform X3 n=1 Tax=Acropora millepora TaxID=45264 RepID=UPI001CF4C03D|nr:DEAD-box ATP-dependent RNA helicase 42-like isoform X3 [Acropora millepora]